MFQKSSLLLELHAEIFTEEIIWEEIYNNHKGGKNNNTARRIRHRYGENKAGHALMIVETK